MIEIQRIDLNVPSILTAFFGQKFPPYQKSKQSVFPCEYDIL
jgi:hypothetical protein